MAQIGGRLLHVANLAGQELEAGLQLFVGLRRFGIVAAQVLEPRAQLVDLAAHFGHLFGWGERRLRPHLSRRPPRRRAGSTRLAFAVVIALSAFSLLAEFFAHLLGKRHDSVTRVLCFHDTALMLDLKPRQLLSLAALPALHLQRLAL